jgi:glycosyltransferase involved in cell wall biosynthesis
MAVSTGASSARAATSDGIDFPIGGKRNHAGNHSRGRQVALTAYPLSSRYQQTLEQRMGGTVEYLGLSDLRQLPLPRMIAKLRSARARTIYIPLEDANSMALLPVLCCVAAFTGATEMVSIDSDFQARRLSRWDIARAAMGITAASLHGALSLVACSLEMRSLLRANRAVATLPKRLGDILYLKTNLWFGAKIGGSVGHIAGVVNAMAMRGYGVDYVAAEPPVLLSPAVRVHQLDTPRHHAMPSELNLYRLQRRFASEPVRSRNRRFDFVYQRLSIGNYAGVVLARQLGLPFVLEYNGSEAWVARHWGQPLRFERQAIAAEEVCLRHAHLVVTVSQVLGDELAQRGIDPRRVVVYPNCVDPSLFDPAVFSSAELGQIRSEVGLRDQDLVVTFVGTFGRWHGVEVLAQTVVRLLHEQRARIEAARVRFLFIGDGLMMPEVRRILDSAAEAKSFVSLPGLISQDRLPGFLAASDILVSPHVPNADGTRFFGSPTKLFEYMAMQKPIVASRLEQIGEILQDGRNALLTTPGDVAELAAGIMTLVDQPELRQRLGVAARQLALSRYTWGAHVDAILEGLTAVLAADGSA